jgi:hypothetical protein
MPQGPVPGPTSQEVRGWCRGVKQRQSVLPLPAAAPALLVLALPLAAFLLGHAAAARAFRRGPTALAAVLAAPRARLPFVAAPALLLPLPLLAALLLLLLFLPSAASLATAAVAAAAAVACGLVAAREGKGEGRQGACSEIRTGQGLPAAVALCAPSSCVWALCHLCCPTGAPTPRPSTALVQVQH